MGIVDKIPFDGVEMLIGNELVGGKAELCPVLYEEPVVADETCNVSNEVSD